MSGDHKTLIKGSPSQYVKLNVGGNLFYTTIGTLTKSDNMLRTMFSGRMEVLTDSEGTLPTFLFISTNIYDQPLAISLVGTHVYLFLSGYLQKKNTFKVQ